jgi:hypothetical protein
MMYVLIAFVLYLIVVGASQRGNGTSGAFRVGAGDNWGEDQFDDHKMVLMGERDICTSLSLGTD